MISRRTFLKSLGRFSAIGLGTATYGAVIEPGFMLRTQAYAFTPPNWTPGLKLRVAMVADPHVVDPYFPLLRWQHVMDAVNALEPDVILMLGDYVSGLRPRLATVPNEEIACVAASARAPLGTHCIFGNHDWWEDRETQRLKKGPPAIQKAFEDAGLSVFSNRAQRFAKDGLPFWLSGTESLVSFRLGLHQFEGSADLKGTLAQVTDNAPIIHLAHEPDIFVDMPARVSLTVSGHTHGGQLRIAGYSPIVPSGYGNRFAYGHVIEDGRHLVVSGGLGVSNIPMRFGVPPEINLLELG